ncbi:putative uncharacterized protein [Firmicutes bacterium CAG:227]|nr:putative uncharacterized protein [Firmicutes bacterium CAG:227]
MKNKSGKIVAVAVLGLAGILCIALLTAGYLKKTSEAKKVSQNKQTSQAEVSQASDDTIEYNGHKYEYNTDLENYLFIGVDKKEEVTLQDTPGTAGQADCVMILSANKQTKKVKVLQVSRDSMTDVDIYDANGNYYTSVRAQIATQYAYGDGKQSSCLAMEKTVSELLYDLPIAGYVSLDIAGIHAINDAVGGVTITVPEDYTYIDSAFQKGAEITLTGDLAELYVRYRDINQEGSNNERMRRQTQYIPALISTIRKNTSGIASYYNLYKDVLAPYMVTDLGETQIDRLSSYELEEETEYVPGEVVPGEVNEEFHVNEEQLRDLLINMFYKLVQ